MNSNEPIANPLRMLTRFASNQPAIEDPLSARTGDRGRERFLPAAAAAAVLARLD